MSYALSTVALAHPSIYPTGVTRYDRSAAYKCDFLFSGPDHKTYLINMDGQVIHHWDAEGFPAKMLDPALMEGVRGIVGLQLSAISVAPGTLGGTGLFPGLPAVFRNKTIGLVDWNGSVVWSWGERAPGGAARQHPDWARLANGNMLVLANKSVVIAGFAHSEMLDDVIYEVNPAGHIVWQWLASEHLDEFGFTPSELELVRKSPDVDYLHINDLAVLGPNRWEKSSDQRFAADNIMIDSRDANFIIVIRRSTGKVVWRIGPDYPRDPPVAAVPRPVDQISGQHDAHMIPEGLPGAGDILIFDNQGEAGYPPVALEVFGGSRVIEIDPVRKEIVWQYYGRSSGQADWAFFSAFISSAERLPNGNTLIDEGVSGRFFQVTPDGKIVWEYVSPMVGPAGPPLPGHAPPVSNYVYRVQSVPYTWLPDAPAPKKL